MLDFIMDKGWIIILLVLLVGVICLLTGDTTLMNIFFTLTKGG